MVLGMFDTYADAVNEYAIMNLGKVFCIKQYRQRGYTDNAGDGEWKLEYIDPVDGNIHDWIIAIPTRGTDDWCAWTEGRYIQSQYIYIVCVTVDSSGKSGIQELDVKW